MSIAPDLTMEEPAAGESASEGEAVTPSTQDRIRAAALRLFGHVGFDGTSVRAIAAEAAVSPGLVIHHFGSKVGLRVAVDAEVVARFRAAADHADHLTGAAGEVSSPAAWGRAMGSVILADADLRAYLRRSLLDGSAPGSAVLDHLFGDAQRGVNAIAGAGQLRAGIDRHWLPYQILFVVLGPLLFESFMQQHIAGPVFDETTVDRRSAASYDLLMHGLHDAGG